MANNNNIIKRQAALFHQIEQFIRTSEENNSEEYGYNIPMEYDIIMAIYHEVNTDLRNTSDLKLRNDLIYSKMNLTPHKQKKKTK